MVLSLFLHFCRSRKTFFHTSSSRKDKRNGEEQTISRWTKLTKNYNSEQKQNFQNNLVRKRKSVTYLNEESSLTAFWYLLSMCMCEQFFRTTWVGYLDSVDLMNCISFSYDDLYFFVIYKKNISLNRKAYNILEMLGR